MSILTLFCKIDNFFLLYTQWQTTHCLPETTTPETRGRPRQLHPSELKTQTQVEHSRHRSFVNFQVNVISALIAYQLLETKPSLNISELQGISDLPMLF